MISTIKDLDLIIKLFQAQSKGFDELEQLSQFLSQFEGIGTYMQNFNMQHRFKIIETFELKTFVPNEIIFKKGDPSAFYYFILDGVIEAYNEERDGNSKFIGAVGFGKQLGEIGILQNQTRSLTCIAKTHGFYLTLSAENFIKLLAPYMLASLDKKIKFIEHYFPNVKKLTSVKKQRISYAMGSIHASKGQIISTIREDTNFLYFVCEGELSVTLSSEKTKKKMVLKIAPGNLVGEECVLFNGHLKYNVKVSSEYSLLYTLKKQDIYVLLPSETIETWKRNFRAKDTSRLKLSEGLSQALQSPIRVNSHLKNYKQATSYANKRLNTIQKLNETSWNSLHPTSNNLLINLTLKQCSPASIFSSQINIPKLKKGTKLNGYASGHILRFKESL